MKNRQGLTIAALIIAIVGLSIGFAAFSNTLTISSSASVNPDPTSMNVVFSSSSSSAETNPITPTKNLDNVENFTATNATITGADYRTLNNVIAAFTAPGQNVTYNLYVYNAGSYKAYLNELNMGTKTCSIVENQEHPEQEATESLKDAACNGISITVKIDNVTLTSSGSLNNMELDVDTSKPVQIVISYASNASFVDGPISVSFGNITFNATSAPISSGSQDGGQAAPTYSVGDTYNGDFISTQQGVLTGYNGNGGSITIPEKLPVVTQSSVTYNSTKCAALAEQIDAAEGFCGEVVKYLNGETYNEEILDSDSVDSIEQDLSSVADIEYTVTDATEYNITSMTEGAFGMKGIASVDFSEAIYLTQIPGMAFVMNDITELDIPSNITSIGAMAFAYNSSLTSVRIHNNQSSIYTGNSQFPSGTQIVFDDGTITVE